VTTEIFFPTGVKVQGNDKIVAMTAVADESAPSLASEINAATSVELTKAMYGAWDAPVSVDTGSAPTRVGTEAVLPEEGNANRQIIPAAFPVDPSKPKTDPVNKVWATLVKGAILEVFVRRGVSKDTPFAVGDTGLVYKVRVGYVPEPSRTGDDAYAEYQVATNLIPLTEEPVEAVLAA
jgi:hypothetical protein